VRDQQGGTISLYVDGVHQGTRENLSLTALRIDPNGLLLGQDQDSVGGGFQVHQALRSDLDELRIWNSVRTLDDIEENMSRPLTGAEQNLLACYRFNEQTGSDAFSSSTPGAETPALSFDGIDDYIQVANSETIDIRRTITVEVTFEVSGFTNSWMPLIWKGMGGNDARQRTYSLWINSAGSLHFASGDGVVQNTLNTDPGSIQTGRTYHFSGVIDRETGVMAIYLDGDLVKSGNVRQTDTASNTNPLLIGSTLESNSSYSHFAGFVEEARIWNSARSGEEIAANLDVQLNGTEEGLVAYWLPANVSGNQLEDLSSHANDGLLGGGTSGREPRLVRIIPEDGFDAELGGYGLSGPERGLELAIPEAVEVAIPGDVNGDGLDDILMVDAAGENGQISLWLTDTDWLKGEHTRFDFSGPGVGQVSIVGDLNRDGYDEIAVSGFSEAAGDGAGGLFVFFGDPNIDADLSPANADLVFARDEATALPTGAYFEGPLQATAGDFNADGQMDLVIGEPWRAMKVEGFETDRNDQGRTYLYFSVTEGSASRVLSDADAILEGEFEFDKLGTLSDRPSSDLDGDGIDDLLLGAEGADGIATGTIVAGAGRIYLVPGSAELFDIPDTFDILTNWTVTGNGDFIVDRGTGQAEVFESVFESGQSQRWFRFATLGDGQSGNAIVVAPAFEDVHQLSPVAVATVDNDNLATGTVVLSSSGDGTGSIGILEFDLGAFLEYVQDPSTLEQVLLRLDLIREQTDVFAAPFGVENLVASGDKLFFVASDGPVETLWVSDGTLEGTRSLASLGISDPDNLTDVEGILYFTANPDTTTATVELWTLDSETLEAKQVVVDLAPSSEGVQLGELPLNAAGFVANGDRIYFIADDTVPLSLVPGSPYAADYHGIEVWVSDGTTSGTLALDSSAVPDRVGIDATDITPVGESVLFPDTIFFSGPELDARGRPVDGISSLWSGEGSGAEGTVPVVAVNELGESQIISEPTDISGYGGLPFYAAEDGSLEWLTAVQDPAALEAANSMTPNGGVQTSVVGVESWTTSTWYGKTDYYRRTTTQTTQATLTFEVNDQSPASITLSPWDTNDNQDLGDLVDDLNRLLMGAGVDDQITATLSAGVDRIEFETIVAVTTPSLTLEALSTVWTETVVMRSSSWAGLDALVGEVVSHTVSESLQPGALEFLPTQTDTGLNAIFVNSESGLSEEVSGLTVVRGPVNRQPAVLMGENEIPGSGQLEDNVLFTLIVGDQSVPISLTKEDTAGFTHIDQLVAELNQLIENADAADQVTAGQQANMIYFTSHETGNRAVLRIEVDPGQAGAGPLGFSDGQSAAGQGEDGLFFVNQQDDTTIELRLLAQTGTDADGVTPLFTSEQVAVLPNIPSELFAAGDRIFFTIVDGDGVHLWVSDGSGDNTGEISLFPEDTALEEFTDVDGRPFFRADTGAVDGAQLFEVLQAQTETGEPLDTPFSLTAVPVSQAPLNPENLEAVGERLFFTAADTLYVTTGVLGETNAFLEVLAEEATLQVSVLSAEGDLAAATSDATAVASLVDTVPLPEGSGVASLDLTEQVREALEKGHTRITLRLENFTGSGDLTIGLDTNEAGSGSVLEVTTQTGGVLAELYDANGAMIDPAKPVIDMRGLEAGTYYLRVFDPSAEPGAASELSQFEVAISAPIMGWFHPETDRDEIHGGDGDDLIIGNAMVDGLWGDSGQDVFRAESMEIRDLEPDENFKLPPSSEFQNMKQRSPDPLTRSRIANSRPGSTGCHRQSP
jgi:hypothetical protein